VAARVAIGQTAHQYLVKRGAGDNAKLAEPRDSLREAPVGHTNAHATLDDSGELDHPLILSQFHLSSRKLWRFRPRCVTKITTVFEVDETPRFRFAETAMITISHAEN
jgi:hypothetical protein